MADIKNDPLTEGEELLWRLLEASPDFSRRFKPGDRIRYVGAIRDPEKQEIQTEDRPEVRIIPGGVLPHTENTSNSSRMTVKYMIEVRSGTKVLDKAHYPMVWAVFKALTAWRAKADLLTIAENNSKVFIVLVRAIGEVFEALERGEVSQGIEGWFAIWTIEMDMSFTTANLS